jgi:hypothetical protein
MCFVFSFVVPGIPAGPGVLARQVLEASRSAGKRTYYPFSYQCMIFSRHPMLSKREMNRGGLVSD